MATTNRDPITGLLHYEFPQAGFQKRMHKLIYDFVGRYFDRKVDQTVDELTRRLHDGNSPLYQALCHIRKVSTFDGSDYEIRFQYLEVKGPRRTSSISKWKVVLEAAAYFYAKIYYYLHTIYGSKTSEEVMVVCPFAETLEWWNQVIEKDLATVNKRLVALGLPHGRNHHPRIISNSDDQNIRSTVVIIDPANQDGTKFGQGFSKQEMVKIAISRAKEAFIIIGNSCEPYPGRRTAIGNWKGMDSALNAAHEYALWQRGLLKCEDSELEEPLVSLVAIPETLLLNTELKAYAKLRNSSDGTSGGETLMGGQDGVEASQSGSEEIAKLVDLTLPSLGEGDVEKGAVAEDPN